MSSDSCDSCSTLRSGVESNKFLHLTVNSIYLLKLRVLTRIFRSVLSFFTFRFIHGRKFTAENSSNRSFISNFPFSRFVIFWKMVRCIFQNLMRRHFVKMSIGRCTNVLHRMLAVPSYREIYQ